MCLVCAAVALLALPAAAGAKLGSHKHPGLFQLHVSLPTRNGYSIELHAEDHRHVELSASKGAVSVGYSVLGHASSRRVDADFGTLGEVHIRFHLKQELVVPLFPGKKRCGERIGFYGGRFRGSVDFTGEPGVAGVHSLHGGVFLLHIKHICKHAHRRLTSSFSRSVEEKARPAEEVDLLSAKLKEEGRTISFEALQFKGDPREPHSTMSFLSADVSERLGRVKIERIAFEVTPKKVLRLSRRGKQPETAALEPVTPFAGSASYSAASEAPASWSGDLSIPLPGVGTVPLTGPGFSAELCRAFAASEAEDCSPASDLPPPPSVVAP
ncbi:MAG: hypothetical protein ACTHK3_06335 [Solirubrobacterales bacterium]